LALVQFIKTFSHSLLPSRLRVVCTIVSGEIAYQEPELDWQVNVYLSVAFAFAACQAVFFVSTHVSLIRRVAGHAGSCACEHDTTRRFDIGSKSNEERAGRGLRNIIAELRCVCWRVGAAGDAAKEPKVGVFAAVATCHTAEGRGPLDIEGMHAEMKRQLRIFSSSKEMDQSS
jgi:hypothetical protein